MPRRVNFFRNNFLYPRSQPIKMPATRSILVFIEIKQLCLLRNRTNYYSSLLTNSNVQNSIQNCFKNISKKKWSRFEKFHKCVFRLTKTAQYFILWDKFVSTKFRTRCRKFEILSRIVKYGAHRIQICFQNSSFYTLVRYEIRTRRLASSKQISSFKNNNSTFTVQTFYHSYRLLCSNILR